MYTYIYIYIYRERERERERAYPPPCGSGRPWKRNDKVAKEKNSRPGAPLLFTPSKSIYDI